LNSLVASAQGFLEQAGLRLESDVAAAFRSHGFDVYQGLHYTPDRDDATGRREIDVLAVRERINGERPISRGTVAFVVECKSGSTPWIVVAGDSVDDPWGAIDYLRVTGMASSDIVSVLEPGEEPWAFGTPPRHGFRVIAMSKLDPRGDAARDSRTRRRNDPAHDAIRQVVSAAQGVANESPSHLLMAVLPVIVIEGPLLRATFHGDARPEVVASPFERVVWRGELSGRPCVVDVVSFEALHEYCRKADDGAEELIPIFRRVSLELRQRSMEREAPRSLERILGPAIAVGDAVAGFLDRPQKRSAVRPRNGPSDSDPEGRGSA
jgi:hypothetical protein